MSGLTNPTAGWHRDAMMKFIKLYKERPCLWRTDCAYYRNKKARTQALETMVQEMDIMGFDVEYCKIKIKNIRSHYCQELKKIQVSQALNYQKPFVPSIVWFEFLDSFLRDYVHLTNPSEPIEDFSMVSVEINDVKEEPLSPPEIDLKEEPLSDRIGSKHCEVAKKVEPRKRQRNNNKYFKRRKETEFDVFCKSIAIHLKKMPLEDALDAQVQIQNLVSMERLKTIK